MAMTLTELVEQWCAAKKQLADAKQTESALRSAVIARVFPNESATKVGTNRKTIAELRLEVVYTRKENVTIDDATIDDVMTQLVAAFPATEAKELIRWEPQLLKKGYKSLPPAAQAILDQALITKPGSPELDIVTI